MLEILTMTYDHELKLHPYLGQGRPSCQRSNHSNRRAQTNTPTEKQTDPISRTDSLYPGFAKLLMKNIPVLYIQNVINWGNIIPFHFILQNVHPSRNKSSIKKIDTITENSQPEVQRGCGECRPCQMIEDCGFCVSCLVSTSFMYFRNTGVITWKYFQLFN